MARHQFESLLSHRTDNSMRSEDPSTVGGQRDSNPRRRYALVYWQQEGTRHYLRVTPLGLCIVIFLVATSILALMFLFWFRKSLRPAREVDINITTPPAASSSPAQDLIKAVPPGPTPPRVNQPAEVSPKKHQSRNATSTNERQPRQPR